VIDPSGSADPGRKLAQNAGMGAEEAAKEWAASIIPGITAIPSGTFGRANESLAGTGAPRTSEIVASLRVTVSCDDVTLETGLSAAQPLRRHTGIAAQPLRRHRGVTASLFGA
jgi:hypothetical protein